MSFNDSPRMSTWLRSLAFLFDGSLRKIDLGEVKMTEDVAEAEIQQDPRFRKLRVIVTFWVVPK